jgi:hypothetical protein
MFDQKFVELEMVSGPIYLEIDKIVAIIKTPQGTLVVVPGLNPVPVVKTPIVEVVKRIKEVEWSGGINLPLNLSKGEPTGIIGDSQ